MSKILFQIKNNALLVEEKRRVRNEEKLLINTNIISRDELLFSEEYINENKILIKNFIKEIVISYNIDTLIIKELKTTPLILDIIKNISNIKKLYLLEEEIINYHICQMIIATNTIKYVSLYNSHIFISNYIIYQHF